MTASKVSSNFTIRVDPGLMITTWAEKMNEEAKMAADNVTLSYAQGGIVEGGRLETLTVAEIWGAFPALNPGDVSIVNGYTVQEVLQAQSQFAADVRIAAKRNREDAAYVRIEELQ